MNESARYVSKAVVGQIWRFQRCSLESSYVQNAWETENLKRSYGSFKHTPHVSIESNQGARTFPICISPTPTRHLICLLHTQLSISIHRHPHTVT